MELVGATCSMVLDVPDGGGFVPTGFESVVEGIDVVDVISSDVDSDIAEWEAAKVSIQR